MSLVDTDWLEKNLDKVKIIDCSWHMPAENRNAQDEFDKEHIPNAIFFDLDKNSKQDTDLPHMLPSLVAWNEIISDLGISNDDQIVIYDNSNVISSCRGWYNFIYFGHDPKLVNVLDGGFKKWKSENKKTSNISANLNKSNYEGNELSKLVKNKVLIDQNISKKELFKCFTIKYPVSYSFGVLYLKLPKVCLSYLILFFDKIFICVVSTNLGILPLPKLLFVVSVYTASPSQYQLGAVERLNIEDKPSPNK